MMAKYLFLIGTNHDVEVIFGTRNMRWNVNAWYQQLFETLNLGTNHH